MTIGVDATYSLGPHLSGVGVYSREILSALAEIHPEVRWVRYYRNRQYWKSFAAHPNVRRGLLLDSARLGSVDLFHGLNQRLPKRRFRRQVATFHDLFVMSGEYSTADFRARFTAQARRAASDADHLIAVSEFTAGQMQTFLEIPRSRITVIPHGVTPLRVPSLPRENIVLNVGAIQTRKNISRLVRAFEALPRDWRLVLAGSSGFGSESILAHIARSAARDRILITGYIATTELAQWYARSRIFAFPSLDEGFGIPVLEAMSAGVPVIASDRSALPEVCGDAALLVNPENEPEIAAALRQLACNSELREKLAAKGYDRVKSFTWERAAHCTWEVYQTVLRTR